MSRFVRPLSFHFYAVGGVDLHESSLFFGCRLFGGGYRGKQKVVFKIHPLATPLRGKNDPFWYPKWIFHFSAVDAAVLQGLSPFSPVHRPNLKYPSL